MVNELLSFSRAALGRQAKPMEATLLRPLIEDVITKEAIDESLVSLHVGDDLKVEAHVELLRRAIGNVLRNAQLHAPASPIEISADRTHDGLRLIIADHGPGVPADSLPRLFEPFYRVDTSRTRETGGVGLGLSIVKNCVESCGGAVMAENRQPHGLRIIMSLASA
jgi:two-component system sensor histidine kinase CpxA